MLGSYNSALVCLSILIAVTASFTALDLANRLRASQGLTRFAWLVAASITMGGGIWAMHFVGMLAFELHATAVHYDLILTLVSLAVPVAVTALGFLAVSGPRLTASRLIPGGLIMGLGIGAMHYIGMYAMAIPAELSFDPRWVAASFVIAVAAATIALGLSVRADRVSLRALAALAMGVAVSGMHYAAMEGVAFTSGAVVPHHANATLDHMALALVVAGLTFVIQFMALVAAMYDRRLATMVEREAIALRRSEERFRSLYRRTPLPLHSLDLEGRIEFVSEAWVELLGYSLTEVQGRLLVDFMTEDSAQQATLTDWPQLLLEGGVITSEYRMITREGDLLDVIASARMEHEEGRFSRVFGGLTDVTEQRLAEQALRQSQKMEAIGKLTGGVAHDFNNLLAVVVGNLELLRKRMPAEPKLVSLVDNALMGAQRGTSLTQRMLAFARKQELKPESVELPELVRGMSELLQRSVGPGVKINVRFPPDLPRAYVDANQLELVMLNLVVNSRDAMPNGGGISIDASLQSFSTDAAELSTRFLCLAVIDSGEGMDPEMLARATEPFFTTKGVGKGTGLGLSMAQGLAEQSGGRLILKSVKGEGTTVELWLPVADEVDHQQQSQPESTYEPLHADFHSDPLTILVVDDDPLVLTNTAAVLEDLSHRVHCAASGEEALSLLRSGLAVDVLVTDEAMPGMTGTQLASIAQQERPGVPVLLVSGYGESPEGGHTMLPKLRKPFTQAALCRAIGQIVVPADSVEPVHTSAQS